ncbi:glucose-6-phosphate dehydrogenase assembly protein OpcA [Cumulibacter manganitolerans]|uniref:glucose-6-phosphate dehydrogenase assembly protein OpcA n=1 Tax=Cumulibacter manganitolerans TaxID=1884992 RepID=UPI00129697B0|nr:glucose-6-phosphate dehydrogenase assembly protein OpcA [Cumulibacter manganitolerans]
MTTLWDTTGTAVVKALAAERRTGGAVTSGNALTLVVVVDEKYIADAERAAAQAAATNPCRLLIVVRRELDAPQPRLDAEILVGGRLGPGEAIVMRMYGRLALHAESVTLPLLAPDAPVVTWWHGPPPKVIATDAVGVYSDRRITDCGWLGDGAEGLQQRARDYAPGDTDLAWTRTTQWRSALASSFDSISDKPRSAKVLGSSSSPAALLLAGWLTRRLGVECRVKDTKRNIGQTGIGGVEITFGAKGSLTLLREGGDLIVDRSGQRAQRLSIRERDLGELLTEELRRQGADDTYAEALSSATGVPGLGDRHYLRTHIWVDPDQRATQATSKRIAKEAAAQIDEGPRTQRARSRGTAASR